MLVTDYSHPIEIKFTEVTYSDSPSATQLVTVVIDLGKTQLSKGDRTDAYRLLDRVVNNEVRIIYEPKEYDCTGQHYTTGLDRIHRFFHSTGDQQQLVGIYLHNISVDV